MTSGKAYTREWEESPTGLTYPGARFGCEGRVRPSPGGARVEAFGRQHIRQSKGRWRGKPMSFYPEQSGLTHELFRTEMGRRVYTEALIGLPRKNGKSTWAAMIALYLLVADGEPAPEVYGAAGSRDQAKLVFQEASRMVRASPVLSEWCKVYRNEIVVPSLDGVYRAVSAEGGLQMGTNPSAVVADELHVWKGDAGRELYYALSTGMIARENPLFVGITTAGYELDSIAYEIYERGMGGDEANLLFWWIGADPDDDPDDPATWLRANPAPWITEAILRREQHRRPPSVFARLHLNRWTTSAELWLPSNAWRRLADPAMQIRAGERVWLGVDIGFKRDASAIVEVARRDGEGPGGRPRYIARAYIFPPAVDPETGVLDLGPVKAKLRELISTRSVVELRYDRTLFGESAADLSEIVRTVEVPWSSNQRIVEGSEALYELIVEDLLRHDGSTEFRQHVEAGAIRETESGFRITKQKSKRRIDALAALLMAVTGAIDKRRKAQSGGRPIGAAKAKAEATPGTEADHPIGKRSIKRVRDGGIVECSPDEYATVIRAALQQHAEACGNEGDEFYKRLCLNEVRRLDSIHSFDIMRQ